MKTKIYDMKKRAKWLFSIGILFIFVSIILEAFNTGDLYLGRIDFIAWSLNVGLIFVVISIVNYFFRKEIKYDERSQKIILESSKKTFALLIYVSIISMLIGAFYSIDISLYAASSFVLFFTIIVYRIYYWILNKKY